MNNSSTAKILPLSKIGNKELEICKDLIFDKRKYEGDILNAVPNGQGTLTSPDGGKYVGGIKDGRNMVKGQKLTRLERS